MKGLQNRVSEFVAKTQFSLYQIFYENNTMKCYQYQFDLQAL